MGRFEVPDAERYVIGAMLADAGARRACSADLSPGDFRSDTHRAVFVALVGSGDDAAGLTGWVNAGELGLSGDPARLARALVGGVPPVSRWREELERVSETSRARLLAEALEGGSERLRDGASFTEAASQTMGAVEGLLSGGASTGARPIGEAANAVRETARAVRENRGLVGLSTGIGLLDTKLGGLQRGRNYILAARAGHGKSTLAGTIARNVASRGNGVLVQTTEMESDQYLERLARAEAGITDEDWEDGAVPARKWPLFEAALARLSALPIWVDGDPGATPDQLRRNIIRTRPALVVVDYLQRMKAPPGMGRMSEYELVTYLSLEVDRLKTAHSVPILTVAQLNRNSEHRADRRPEASDLRSSGQLEQDGNVILLMHRPGKHSDDEDQELAVLACHKNRHGEDGWIVNLWRQGKCALLTDDRRLVNPRGAA